MICVIYLEMQAKNKTFREERESEYTEMTAVEHPAPDSRLCERYLEKTWYRTTILFLSLKMGQGVGEVLELTLLSSHPKRCCAGRRGQPQTHLVGARPIVHQLCRLSPQRPGLVERRRSSARGIERHGFAFSWCTDIRAPTLPPGERDGPRYPASRVRSLTRLWVRILFMSVSKSMDIGRRSSRYA